MSANLIRYIPEFVQDVLEYQKIFNAENPEFDLMGAGIDSIFPESLIMDCSEERIIEWEEALGITPQGSLTERKYYILGVLNGGDGKLNEALIKRIVYSFTGGDCEVSIAASAILVQVKPPNNGELYRFDDIERALRPKVPAHLGLTVKRFYSTWGDIKNNFASWATVSAMDDWRAVKNWIRE